MTVFIQTQRLSHSLQLAAAKHLKSEAMIIVFDRANALPINNAITAFKILGGGISWQNFDRSSRLTGRYNETIPTRYLIFELQRKRIDRPPNPSPHPNPILSLQTCRNSSNAPHKSRSKPPDVTVSPAARTPPIPVSFCFTNRDYTTRRGGNCMSRLDRRRGKTGS